MNNLPDATSKLIIADARLPLEALQKLDDMGNLFALSSEGITYPAISGHPDIFICPTANKPVVAPNAPQTLFDALKQADIEWTPGENKVGVRYPTSAHYNAVITNEYIIHRPDITDPALRKANAHLKSISVKQGYARCGLLMLPSQKHAITTDAGMHKTLSRRGFDCLLISHESIVLPTLTNGSFGGCCGWNGEHLFLAGALKHHPDGEKIKNYLATQNILYTELYDGPLFDGGGIFFL